MPVANLPIGNGFYVSDSLPLSAQECLNYFVNVPQAQALNDRVLFATPGITEVVTTGDAIVGITRGAWSMNGIPYFVNGANLYRLNSDDSVDDLGTISGTGQVWMSDNGTQLLILVPGGAGYIFVEPATLTTIVDVDFTANGNPLACTFIDGYFVFTTDEKKFIISSINDGLAYNALDFGTAESSPDGVAVPTVFKNQLYIVGETTTEAFNNIGGPDFPFQRSGLFLDQGTVAPFTVTQAPETFMFIGAGKNESPGVWSFANNANVKISTHPIDEILQDLTLVELAQLVGWSYAQGGHYFTGWSLPGTTIVYDHTTQVWHERRSRYLDGSLNLVETTFRARNMVSAYNSIYTGDVLEAKLGIVDPDAYQEYGLTIFRRAATMPFQNNMQPFTVPYLELTVESGVGNAGEAEPQMRMDRSTDGGKTFTWERPRSMGAKGEYNHRCIWRRLGKVDRFDVYRFTTTAPVKVALLALTADIRPLRGA